MLETCSNSLGWCAGSSVIGGNWLEGDWHSLFWTSILDTKTGPGGLILVDQFWSARPVFVSKTDLLWPKAVQPSNACVPGPCLQELQSMTEIERSCALPAQCPHGSYTCVQYPCVYTVYTILLILTHMPLIPLQLKHRSQPACRSLQC